MKKVFTHGLFLLLMLITKVAYAQSPEAEKSVTSMFKLNFFLPGISYEQKIGQYHTAHFATYMDGFINEQYDGAFSETQVFYIPSIVAEIRSYYNLEKRAWNKKRTDSNSGNYFGPIYLGKVIREHNTGQHQWVNQIGAVWGLQRTALSGFSIDFNVGLGYSFTATNINFTNTIDPIIQIALGFRIGKGE